MPTAGMSSSGGRLKRQAKPVAAGRIVENVTNYQPQMIRPLFSCRTGGKTVIYILPSYTRRELRHEHGVSLPAPIPPIRLSILVGGPMIRSKIMNTIHHAAATGFAAKADSYVLGRPDYPPALDAWLRDELDLEPGKTVVDLGAGTGKFTRRLMTTGAAVIAVEPVAEMLQKLTDEHPEISAKSCTAESITLADASVDAVVCAQAFHWFATEAALTEIHRVLKPGGSLGLVWNTRDARIPWVAKLADIFAPYEGDTPRHHTGEWKNPFPFNGFSALREHHFSNNHTGAPEDVIVNRVLSTSFIAALPPEKQERVAADVRTLIANEPTLAGKAEVTLPYDTAAYSCIKE